MTGQARTAVRVDQDLQCTPEQAFDVWLDPVALYRILLASPQGRMAPSHVDPRKGGVFMLHEQRDDLVSMSGRYVELDRPRRLVLGWGEGAEHQAVIEIRCRSAVACALSITITGAAFPEHTREIWTGRLDRLADVLRDPT